MKAHSMEIRECVMRAVDEGELTQGEISHYFGVGPRWVRTLTRRRQETGSIAPLPHGGGPQPKITPEVDEQLKEFFVQHVDATLQEAKIGCGLQVSLSAICRALQRLGLTRKKKTTHATERDCPEVQAKRRHWKRQMRRIDAKRLVFVDETGISTQMQRAYGRAPRGVRVIAAVPETRYHTSTLVGALRLDGSLPALVYDGGTDVSAMLSFIENQLAPVLRHGDIVVWDNLAAHTSLEVIKAIGKTGAKVMSLPTYSPDLNPIEKLWSKMKTILRGAAARTKETLLDALCKALESMTESDIQNWFQNCGYRIIHA